MFCPKCGSQNAVETKFCRGCGENLSDLLPPRLRNAATPPVQAGSEVTTTAFGGRFSGKRGDAPMSIAEQQIDLFSRGIRGLIMGGGLFVVSALAFVLSERGLTFSLFMLAFGFLLVGTGISRLIHARGLKELGKRDEPAELTSGQADYIKPRESIYDTDGLLARPLSVTEHTTTHLEMDTDGDMFSTPKKQ